jgi:hypothetical protein
VASGQQPNCSSYSAVTGGFIFGIHQYPAEALAAWSNFSHAPITMAAAFPIEKNRRVFHQKNSPRGFPWKRRLLLFQRKTRGFSCRIPKQSIEACFDDAPVLRLTIYNVFHATWRQKALVLRTSGW